MLLRDKVALITGGGSGIGAATAIAFSNHGARVAFIDLNADAAARTESAIAASGGKVRSFVADAAQPEVLDDVYGRVAREFGRLDVVHNNHVWAENGEIGEISLDGFRRSLEVGLTSYLASTQRALRLMLPQGGGVIVNTASICGIAGDFTIGAYNVVKAGVVNLSRATALDYADRGIRCNALCPGPTLTRPYQELRVSNPKFYERTRDAAPMGRLAEPDEIADAVVFLASDLARYVTGTTLIVDGGLSAWTGLPPAGSMRAAVD